MLSAAVAGIITGVLTKGAQALAKEVGEAASNVAQTIAQAVLDRLRSDPAEERTVERYEGAPQAQQASLEAAIADLAEADSAFAARLEELVGQYEAAKTPAMVAVQGNVEDGQVIGQNEGIAANRNSGTITQNRSD